MNYELKKKWVWALRSGLYKQGTKFLHVYSDEGRNNTFCPLGVLVDICGEEWVKGDFSAMTIFDEPQILPKNLMKKYGLSSDEVYVITMLNDRSLYSFEQIATYIARNVPGV